MLSVQFQISESLSEECEAVSEVRPPRRVARISVFQWCCDGSVLLKQHQSRGDGDHVSGLRVIVPWWKRSDSRSGLQRAATFGVVHHW